jgi:hypothetical protein
MRRLPRISSRAVCGGCNVRGPRLPGRAGPLRRSSPADGVGGGLRGGLALGGFRAWPSRDGRAAEVRVGVVFGSAGRARRQQRRRGGHKRVQRGHWRKQSSSRDRAPRRGHVFRIMRRAVWSSDMAIGTPTVAQGAGRLTGAFCLMCCRCRDANTVSPAVDAPRGCAVASTRFRVRLRASSLSQSARCPGPRAVRGPAEARWLRLGNRDPVTRHEGQATLSFVRDTRRDLNGVSDRRCPAPICAPFAAVYGQKATCRP